mmetsp:Transcript_8275/g.9379  ORF Transcript_8275/g.9379 Transcript_8275/m.9379 type:complete len:141 (-) Transcript_8275:29-451(-)
MDYAFDYLVENHFCDGSEYPYTATDGVCHESTCVTGPSDSGFHDYKLGDEDAVLTGLLDGPVAVAVDASIWSFYKGGVLNEPNCFTQLNHGVTLVASNFEQGYITIRNSWGSDWGENGHIRLALGNNMCGYANAASVPTF